MSGDLLTERSLSLQGATQVIIWLKTIAIYVLKKEMVGSQVVQNLFASHGVQNLDTKAVARVCDEDIIRSEPSVLLLILHYVPFQVCSANFRLKVYRILSLS